MANYKNIVDVDVLAEASESTNVLVEENGSLKKVPASAVGGSAGGGMFRINLSWDGDTPAADKTLSEIVAAYENGNLPVMVDFEGNVYHLAYAPSIDDEAIFNMMYMMPGRVEVDMYQVWIKPDGTTRSACMIISGELDYDTETKTEN